MESFFNISRFIYSEEEKKDFPIGSSNTTDHKKFVNLIKTGTTAEEKQPIIFAFFRSNLPHFFHAHIKKKYAQKF